jgi:hypothetical protein
VLFVAVLFVAVLFVLELDVVELYPGPPVQPISINDSGATNKKEPLKNWVGRAELADRIFPPLVNLLGRMEALRQGQGAA